MSLNALPFTAVDLLGACVATAVTILAGRRRHSPGGLALAVATGACAWWCLVHGLSLMAATLQAKIALAWVWYLGAAVAPWGVLVFAVQYLRQERHWRRWVLAAAVPPVATLLLLWTNDWHHLFWTRTYLDLSGPFPLFGVVHGPAFWVSLLFSDTAVIVESILILRIVVTHEGLYRRQALLLGGGILLPLAADVMYVTGHSPLPNLDFTPSSLAIGLTLIGWALYGQRLLDIMPIAHQTVIEGIGDAVIVVDLLGRVIYVNKAGEALGGSESMIGQPITVCAPGFEGELVRGIGSERHVYDVRCSTLTDRSAEPCGWAITLRDVSDRHRADRLQRSRRQIIAAEEHTRRQISEMLHGTVQTKLLATWFSLGDYQKRWATSPEAVDALEAIRGAIERIREEDVRQASHLLHPSIIRAGLIPAIEYLASGFQGFFAVDVAASAELRDLDRAEGMEESLRLVAYRIVEEALNNAAKHAQAQRVSITLSIADDTLRLAVVDDGKGFDPASVTPGLGLASTEARVEQAGGSWQIDSAPERGASVVATLPMRSPEAALAIAELEAVLAQPLSAAAGNPG